MHDAVFVTPWPFWIAGFAIGLFVTIFALATRKAVGVSSCYLEVCSLAKPAGADRWKIWFLIGLPIGGFLARWGQGEFAWTPSLGSGPALLEIATFAFGGVLIGFGARTAGGCTSGHSIVGIALGARSSLIATCGFMIGGFGATWALVAVRALFASSKGGV